MPYRTDALRPLGAVGDRWGYRRLLRAEAEAVLFVGRGQLLEDLTPGARPNPGRGRYG